MGCNAIGIDVPATFLGSLSYVDDVLASLEVQGVEDWILHEPHRSITGAMVASTAGDRSVGPVVLAGVSGVAFVSHPGCLGQRDVRLENTPSVADLFEGRRISVELQGGAPARVPGPVGLSGVPVGVGPR